MSWDCDEAIIHTTLAEGINAGVGARGYQPASSAAQHPEGAGVSRDIAASRCGYLIVGWRCCRRRAGQSACGTSEGPPIGRISAEITQHSHLKLYNRRAASLLADKAATATGTPTVHAGNNAQPTIRWAACESSWPPCCRHPQEPRAGQIVRGRRSRASGAMMHVNPS